MNKEIQVPALPEANPKATLAALHVGVGDRVEPEQMLMDIETDKVVLEVVAPDYGYVAAIHPAVGDKVRSEQIIAVLTPLPEAEKKQLLQAADPKPSYGQLSPFQPENAATKSQPKADSYFPMQLMLGLAAGVMMMVLFVWLV